MVHIQLRIFSILSLPQHLPYGSNHPDRCAPKCNVKQQIRLSLPFSICVVVLFHAVFALCHWQLSARFVGASVIGPSTSIYRLSSKAQHWGQCLEQLMLSTRRYPYGALIEH
jgi:hypothetical protein